MRWTAERIIWACLLASSAVGIVILLAYLMPKWDREDKLKEGKID